MRCADRIGERGDNGNRRFQPQAPHGGHLFQGRYKAIVCEKDEYLLTLVRYIHLNPIRAKLVHGLDDYPYGGHREYWVLELLKWSRRAGYWTCWEGAHRTSDLSKKACAMAIGRNIRT